MKKLGCAVKLKPVENIMTTKFDILSSLLLLNNRTHRNSVASIVTTF